MSQDRPDVVLRGRAVVGDGVVPDAVVHLRAGVVVRSGPAADVLPLLDDVGRAAVHAVPAGAVLLPGLVDLHCHGAAGHDFGKATTDAARTAADHHLRHGTTSLLASVVSSPREGTTRALGRLSRLARAQSVDGPGSPVEGVHLEGPYLSVARCGAQDPRVLRDPDLGELDGWLTAAAGGLSTTTVATMTVATMTVATMTVAPERPRALDVAERLLAAGVVPAVGHTDADEVTTTAFLRAAAVSGRPALVTHLFNGMRPMHHRDPGPVAASLAAAARGEAVVELVADGVHLDDGTVRTVFDLVGAGAVALVTDAMAATGVSDGEYRIGALDVRVRDGVARLVDGGSIAGGTTRLLDVVRRLVLDVGLPLADVVRAASATPARVLGREHEIGSLLPGRRADLVVVDDGLEPIGVLRAGAWVTRPPWAEGGIR